MLNLPFCLPFYLYIYINLYIYIMDASKQGRWVVVIQVRSGTVRVVAAGIWVDMHSQIENPKP